ncbi:MAG: septum formation initiator family protein [Prevotella sp.]|nr:septum formation initiator family protein [Prevotella sp.]
MKDKLKKVMKGVGRFLGMKYNKYIIVLAVGILIVGFLGDNSVVAHLQNNTRKNELRKEIAVKVAQTKANQEQVHLLQTDPKAVERVGREQHFMKHDDEDVFVLSDDPKVEELTVEDETIE